MLLNQVIILTILIFTIIVLVTEKISMSIVGLTIPTLFILTGILPTKQAFIRFVDPNIILIASVLVISGAMMEVGIAEMIGNKVKSFIDRTKGGEVTTLLVVMIVTILMCTGLPRVGVTAAMLPLIISISKSTGISRSKLLFVMALTASFGGNITVIATPPNLVAKSALEANGIGTITFFEFGFIGIPLAIIGIIFILMIRNTRILPERYKEVDCSNEELILKTVSKRKQLITTISFLVFILGMIFEKNTGIDGYVIGTICAIVLILTNTITERFAFFESVDWGLLFFIAGMLTLGDGLKVTGTGELITEIVIDILGQNPNPIFLTSVLFLLATFLTQIMSNTGAAGILIPISLSLASGLGLEPKAVIMAIVLGCNSSYLTPMATPSNALILVPGKIKFGDFIKGGLPLLLFTFILVILILPRLYPY